jgi:hypothetical protein
MCHYPQIVRLGRCFHNKRLRVTFSLRGLLDVNRAFCRNRLLISLHWILGGTISQSRYSRLPHLKQTCLRNDNIQDCGLCYPPRGSKDEEPFALVSIPMVAVPESSTSHIFRTGHIGKRVRTSSLQSRQILNEARRTRKPLHAILINQILLRTLSFVQNSGTTAMTKL